jgi:hypothetical protein
MPLNQNTLKRFVGQYASAAMATVATVPSGKQWIIKSIDICNVTTNDRTVSLRIGTADSIAILKDFPLAAKGTAGSKYERDWATIIMETAEVIQVGADSADALAVIISGVEVTL